jgi:hypothetical protein
MRVRRAAFHTFRRRSERRIVVRVAAFGTRLAIGEIAAAVASTAAIIVVGAIRTGPTEPIAASASAALPSSVTSALAVIAAMAVVTTPASSTAPSLLRHALHPELVAANIRRAERETIRAR